MQHFGATKGGQEKTRRAKGKSQLEICSLRPQQKPPPLPPPPLPFPLSPLAKQRQSQCLIRASSAAPLHDVPPPHPLPLCQPAVRVLSTHCAQGRLPLGQFELPHNDAATPCNELFERVDTRWQYLLDASVL